MAKYVGYGTGKRKDAVAKVWLMEGAGDVVINGQSVGAYLKRDTLAAMVAQPLRVTELSDRFDVKVTVQGGGMSGQAGAVRHGIAKALVDMDPGLRSVLGPAGLLTRDPRVKERKHAGFRKARRGKQFSKR